MVPAASVDRRGISHPRAFAAYAWVALGYTQAVVLWGAFVRAAGAGNGCGPTWPLCDGQYLPRHPQLKMLIEFLHRASSGLDAALVLGLFAAAFLLFPRRHAVRRGAAAALVFLVLEALLGAALVLFGWVGANASPARTVADSLHLANTLLLLASLVLAAAWASGLPAPDRRPARRTGVMLGVAIVAVLVTCICGTLAALADTLFPSPSLAVGVRQDFSAAGHYLVRVRILHPALALLTGLYLFWMLLRLLPHAAVAARGLGYALAAAVLVQWSAGLVDLVLLTPVAMQLLHLLIADLLWLVLVLFTAAALAPPAVARQPFIAPSLPASPTR